jgi:serine/threonine protein kinase
MEYCPHGELFNLVRQHGHLSEVQSRFIIREVLEALNYIHSQGIAHRDIKLENIFLSRKCHVKLGDFGLGKYVGPDGICGTSCGSPYYASPECLSGNAYNAKKSDIWSCGVTLYWMLVGEPPWADRNHFQLFEQIRKGDLKIPIGLSTWCRDFLGKLLTVDPDRRIGIVEAFEHPWLKAGPNSTFPDEPPFPYIGIRRVESLFDDPLPGLDSLERAARETPSVRAASITQLEKLLIPAAVRRKSLGPGKGDLEGQGTAKKRAIVVVPHVCGVGGSRRGIRVKR